LLLQLFRVIDKTLAVTMRLTTTRTTRDDGDDDISSSLPSNTFHSSTDSGQNPPEFKRKTTLHKTDQSYTKEVTIKGRSSCVQSYHIRKNSTNDVNDDEQRIVRRLGPMSLAPGLN